MKVVLDYAKMNLFECWLHLLRLVYHQPDGRLMEFQCTEGKSPPDKTTTIWGCIGNNKEASHGICMYPWVNKFTSDIYPIR